MNTVSAEAQAQIGALMARGPVIPVIVVEDLAHAAPLAEALFAGGLTVLEVTLRTPVALDAVRAMRAAVPDAIVGVGTVLTRDQLDAAADAGAAFAVSPGATDRLLADVAGHRVPLLPGAATVSEAMRLREYGYRHLKFFPAEAAGGARFLSSLSSVIADLKFCPTGGVTPENAPSYLKLPNVLCVGGSWMVPRALIDVADWESVRATARAASNIARRS